MVASLPRKVAWSARRSYEASRPGRLRRGVESGDPLLSAAREGRLDWTTAPGGAAAVRAGRRFRDARTAARSLGLASALLAARATVVPFALTLLSGHMPAGWQAALEGYFDPTAAHVAGVLAALTVALALLAGRRPLVAATLALAALAGATAPFVLADPHPLTGGHVGTAVVGLVLLRAWFAGLAHRTR